MTLFREVLGRPVPPRATLVEALERSMISDGLVLAEYATLCAFAGIDAGPSCRELLRSPPTTTTTMDVSEPTLVSWSSSTGPRAQGNASMPTLAANVLLMASRLDPLQASTHTRDLWKHLTRRLDADRHRATLLWTDGVVGTSAVLGGSTSSSSSSSVKAAQVLTRWIALQRSPSSPSMTLPAGEWRLDDVRLDSSGGFTPMPTASSSSTATTAVNLTVDARLSRRWLGEDDPYASPAFDAQRRRSTTGLLLPLLATTLSLLVAIALGVFGVTRCRRRAQQRRLDGLAVSTAIMLETDDHHHELH